VATVLDVSKGLEMAAQVIVNEPVQVLVRMLPSGKIVPTSFVWRDRSRYVSDAGRQWEERVEGKSVRCFLVKTVDNDTYELRWDPAADTWSIHRAWLQNLA
jgi:hypothetical protein